MYDCVAHGSDGNIEAMSIYVRAFFTASQTINCIVIYESRSRSKRVAFGTYMLEEGRVRIRCNQNTLDLGT
jgi:hypothetical protein